MDERRQSELGPALAHVREVLEACGLTIGQSLTLPGRSRVSSEIPVRLASELRTLLQKRFPNGLHSHQSAAIDAVLDGEDVCLSTSTASGKTLVFIATVADLLLRDRAARVLALYPARALIQDQREKWGSFLDPLRLRYSHIDGGVPVAERGDHLASSHVVLMTPDVMHAWMMSNLGDDRIHEFLGRLRLLILDETHVYEGAFGTNMAYLLRRLEAATGQTQLICSTATLGEPASFVERLTGRNVTSFGPLEDGSPMPPKEVVLLAGDRSATFEATVNALRRFSEASLGRFLAFADSRKAVELIVAATHRGQQDSPTAEESDVEFDDAAASADEQDEEDEFDDEPTPTLPGQRILPYRAGYETEDRLAIQHALATGDLVGVVTTSALELGLDIGEIDLVLLLDVPPTLKAFWQRIGRGGRKNPGICLMFDPRGKLAKLGVDLAGYLQHPIEPNWLYLDNRYIQYANVLCAAVEAGSRQDKATPESFRTLPPLFLELLENELHPQELVPPDLYQLKQRGQNDPHHEFALRGGVEQSFKIRERGRNLGEATLAQALREAYPGAIYYYMARPYRIQGWYHRKGIITARPSPMYTTRPANQTMVFPRFEGGILTHLRSDRGFVAEAEMQVSERVVGFSELRGPNRIEHRYGPGSPYAQREIYRFFETSGVCWELGSGLRTSEASLDALLQTFAAEFGVQERDLGFGYFHSNVSPDGPGPVRGTCIYDTTQGSLRLTQLLATHFPEMIGATLDAIREGAMVAPAEELEALRDAADGLVLVAIQAGGPEVDEGDWMVIIAPGQRAMFLNNESTREVTVLDYVYTPRGLMYQLEDPNPKVKWRVPSTEIQPIYGSTKLQRVNLVTDEVEALDGDEEQAPG